MVELVLALVVGVDGPQALRLAIAAQVNGLTGTSKPSHNDNYNLFINLTHSL